MSKKKASSANTMTLKDFHGGSIPSDLPLPSAPGVVKPTDRSGFDRPTPWVNPMMMSRSDHRTRPGSSSGIRHHFDDKTPFLTHTAHVGRNFDEDERKPLDGVSAPRRTVSDESYRASRVEFRPESVSSGRFSGSHDSASVLPLENSYAGRVSEVGHVGVTTDHFVGNGSRGASGTYPNAWGVRKEVVVGAIEEGASSVSKMAHASALDKVTSGRWQSNKSGNYQPDVDINRYSEMENVVPSKGYDSGAHRMDVVGERQHPDIMLARQVERNLSVKDGTLGINRELVDHEMARAPTYSEVKEKKVASYADGVQHARPDSYFGGSEMQPATLLDLSSERPKLKLLTRTKPSETIGPHVESNQDYQWPKDFDHHGPLETINELQGNMNPAKPGLAGSETGNQAVERPKLNIKPRSQPLESYVGHPERERNGLFGGARPREAVLKERGVDDVAIHNQDLDQHPDRIKHAVPKTEKVLEHGVSSRQGERHGSVVLDQRNLKKSERKDNRVDVERVDNWRNVNWRNSREPERQQQQQQQEREPSPETWRKSVEQQPEPASIDAVAGTRYGKAASAVDLALSFSKSHSESDPNTDERYTGQRGHSGRDQKPFSRLIGPTKNPRHQINGY